MRSPAREQGTATGRRGVCTGRERQCAAGRADLCAVGRPHLANPAWTLAEAARIGFTPINWPKQLVSGKGQMEALAQRAAHQAGGVK